MWVRTSKVLLLFTLFYITPVTSPVFGILAAHWEWSQFPNMVLRVANLEVRMMGWDWEGGREGGVW